MLECVNEHEKTLSEQINVQNYRVEDDLENAVNWLKELQEGEGIEDTDSLVKNETTEATGDKDSNLELSEAQLKPIPAAPQNVESSNTANGVDKTSDAMPIGNVFRKHVKTDPRKKALIRHKLWLEDLQHEYPMPYHPYKIGVYIRYYNQTQHKKYYEKHIQQFTDEIKCCKKWTLVDFYIDKGPTAPRMENAKEWCRLFGDCFTGKVDLIVTQKKSNVSSDADELATVVRLLAAQKHPVGIYFVSEDIFTLASYYRSDLRDTCMFPQDFVPLPEDEFDVPMIYEGEKIKQLDLFEDESSTSDEDEDEFYEFDHDADNASDEYEDPEEQRGGVQA